MLGFCFFSIEILAKIYLWLFEYLVSNPDSTPLSSPVAPNATATRPQMPNTKDFCGCLSSWHVLKSPTPSASFNLTEPSSILNRSSESRNSHKHCCEHTIFRNTPTDTPRKPSSAILLQTFDWKVPLTKEWPEKLTTGLSLLKSCKSSDLQKIKSEILHSYELQCRCWYLGYSALTPEFPILLLKEWMLTEKKNQKGLKATCQCWYHLSPFFIFSF